MNSFTYQYPVKNYFGEGALHTALAAELPAMGEKVMLAYGGGSIKRTGLYDEIVAALQDAGKTVVEFPGIMPNPTYEKVQEGARIAREEGVDFILAVGGGSVFDCCKIVSAQVLLDEDIDDFEHVQDKTPTAFIPLGCVVTLSGTGAEQNNGGVITNEATKVKGRGCGRFFRTFLHRPALAAAVLVGAQPPQRALLITSRQRFWAQTISHAFSCSASLNVRGCSTSERNTAWAASSALAALPK